ncbi:MAG: hypothetical protein ABSA72_02160 [Nitrososphaerales archaeon]
MLELSRTWKERSPATDALISEFHPLSMDDIKQAGDLEAYMLQSIRGSMNRVHLIVRNKIAALNPPPEDSICESCHVKGWLQKDFRTSKVDGANAAIWVCTNCADVSARPQPKTTDDKGLQRPKTKVPTLDDNPKLMDPMSDVLERGVGVVKKTGSMSPFGFLETFASSRMLQTFKTPRLELGFDEARKAILAAPPEVTRYALAWLGYITLEGVRYETIFVGGGERGEAQGATMGRGTSSTCPTSITNQSATQ